MPARPDTTEDRRRALRAAVLAWYRRTARDLPWRRTTDPYAILVSEVMAQQTQVARVVPRYEAWLGRWPAVEDLAAASRPDVLAAWVGLGYNSRAVRLHEAARAVARDGWPPDAAGLAALPGVGAYTAAAVASFAFGQRIAAVDVNVRRIADRIGLGEPGELLPGDPEDAATWNQAAMELGATHCRARAVACATCPAEAVCASAHAVVVPPRRAAGEPGGRPRFEDTDRYVRGRIVALLAHGEPLPGGLEGARIDRALAGLRRDGIAEPTGDEGAPLGHRLASGVADRSVR